VTLEMRGSRSDRDARRGSIRLNTGTPEGGF
jgi:hypothetical protein